MSPTQLPAIDDEGGADHPVVLTEAEAAEGLAVYKAVDDLDDDSNGLG